jgi:hypothetical protein
MSVVAVAVGAGAVATIHSANKASKASKNATNAARDVASEELELSRETLDWYKQQYNDQKPLMERAANTADQVTQTQLASMRQNDAISQDYWNYQKNTFRPLEQRMVTDAQNYNSQARQDAEAGKAVATVQQQIDASLGQQQRGMTRMGVNPNDGRFAAMNNQMAMQGALGKAQAANASRSATELQGYARMADAANLGRGLASSQATSAGVSLNAGNNAVNNAGVPLTQAQNATNMVGNGFNTALQGMGSASNTFNSIANSQAGASGNIWGGIGNLAGQFAGSQAGSQWIAGFLPKPAGS